MTSLDKPRIYRTEALVLKGYNYGEADRILTLYTPQAGKLRAIAKGVRRTKSRMSGHLDLFTRSTLLVARGRQLDIVTQADTVENFSGLRTDLWRASLAHYVAELVDAFTVEQLGNYPIFTLAAQAFRHLASSDSVDLGMRSFELQLLSMSGYRPQLHRCLHCDASIEPQTNHFSPRMGGVLCPGCASADSSAPRISVNALKLLRHLQTRDSGVLQGVRIEEEVRREVERRLQEYIVHRLEAQPRASGFLERLRVEGVAR